MSTPFSLRAELKGVEVAPGVTLRYWEAGAGRVLVMLPGLGHAASLYKYQLEGLCDEFRVIALDPRGMASRTNQSAATTTTHESNHPELIAQSLKLILVQRRRMTKSGQHHQHPARTGLPVAQRHPWCRLDAL